MTDSQQKIAARVVRILALLTSAWGILLLLDDLSRNDTGGYLMLVLGPLIMLGARWIDPAKKSSQADLPDASSAEDAPSQETSSEAAGKDPH